MGQSIGISHFRLKCIGIGLVVKKVLVHHYCPALYHNLLYFHAKNFRAKKFVTKIFIVKMIYVNDSSIRVVRTL